MTEQKRFRARVVKTVAIAFGCVLVLGGAGTGWVYWHLDHNIRGIDIDSALGDDRPARPVAAAASPTAAASPSSEPVEKGVLNILVLGSDSRTGKANKALGGGDSGGARSDTAMVVHLDADRTGGTVVSIPRDTLVERPSCPTESGGTTVVAYNVMFNSAYSVGGPVCAVKTVEHLTGVRMDHYLEVDFAGFAKIVDALGGVDVTTDEAIDDDLSHLHLKAGDQHLDGAQALAFARTRHGIGDGSDLGRIKLQQQLVKALIGKLSTDGLLTDPARLYKIADAATGSLTADTGLDSLTELSGLARSVSELSADSLKTVMMPVVQAPSDANRVVADEPEAGKLWKSLR
ncbi:LCP family protein [Streptomyces sp. NPDC102467]|uniref:LCP family protein n=1 Tax=Streptomyces sp. NPDC102467 TaxID=3366179 RepID=UPI00382A8AFA